MRERMEISEAVAIRIVWLRQMIRMLVGDGQAETMNEEVCMVKTILGGYCRMMSGAAAEWEQEYEAMQRKHGVMG